MNKWICCQLGAREHYAIPRALNNQKILDLFITDAWISSSSLLNLLPKFFFNNLRERYHSELSDASVKSLNYSLITWEMSQKYRKNQAWEQITARNSWWQGQVLKILKKRQIVNKNVNQEVTLFAYSYAALELFKYAKSQGWKTVLGQIDPGIIEEKLLITESQKYPHYQSSLKLASLPYWTAWREECALADEIIVNSVWSSQALQKTGIPSRKIRVIPLAYEPSIKARKFQRIFPQEFDTQRPLRVLFLGQVILRKGVAAILETIELLANKPIEFWFVGQVEIDLPRTLQNNPKIKWFGAVSRRTTSYYYQQADVFLFPTLSDGFGLTQLEAQAWKLPLITSKFCGSVVEDKINGLVLPCVTPKAIAEAIGFCLNNPQKLSDFSQTSHQILANFSLAELGTKLKNIDTQQNNHNSLTYKSEV